MNSSQKGPADIAAENRLAVLANATADAQALMSRGKHETIKGALGELPSAEVDRIIATWPEAAKMGVTQMTKQYGLPNERTATKLL